MKAFRVTGTAPFGQQRQAFSMDLQSVTEIDPRTSQEPAVLHHFREDIAAAGGPIAPAEEE